MLLLENNEHKTSHKKSSRPTVEMKDYDVIADVRNVFHQFIRNSIKVYEIRKIATGQGDDYTTDCLIDYPYLKWNHKLIQKQYNRLDLQKIYIV